MNVKFTHRPDRQYPWQWYYSPQGEEFPEVQKWLIETYGYYGDRWDGHGGWIMFKEESDAALFTLKWS